MGQLFVHLLGVRLFGRFLEVRLMLKSFVSMRVEDLFGFVMFECMKYVIHVGMMVLVERLLKVLGLAMLLG